VLFKRRRLKQTRALKASSLKDRLVLFAKDLREQASQLPAGLERDDALRKARRANTAAHLDDWANSPGLQPLD
jgi:hypothetical protein